MAIPSLTVASPSCRVALCQRVPFQCHSHYPISASFHVRVRSSMIGSWNDPSKLKMRLVYAVKKLNGFIPDSIHNYPWKKAKSIAIQQLLVLGQKILKWSLIALLIFSSSCDILSSIYRNKELLIPFGLYFGCLAANFLKETSHEILQSKEAGMTWHLFAISTFFILVKIIAINFSDLESFLLHIANGGLIQVLGHWVSSSQPGGDQSANANMDDASASSSAAS